MTQATGLGKGLSALLGEQVAVNTPQDNSSSTGTKEIPLSEISAWSKQPRQFFDEAELDELSNSIVKNGVVQPILVRKAKKGYEIIAGERRWRAAKKAGIKNIPVVVMEVDDERALEIALVENIQRKDLTPIEMASSYQRLIDGHKYTQEKLAEVIGKSRSQVTNTLRLLSLPESVKALLNEEKLSAGHARALIGSKYAEDAANKIVKQGLSVRQAEKFMKSLSEPPRKLNNPVKKDADIKNLEEKLSKTLGFEVKIDDRGNKGKLTIRYNSLEELDAILQRLQNKNLAA